MFGQNITLKIPKRKISVQYFRPNAQDFLTNLDSISIQSFGMRHIEPTICNRIRQYVDQQLNIFHQIVLHDIKKITNTLVTSKSDYVATAINEARAANKKIYQDFAILGGNLLTDINTKCAKLTSVNWLSNIIQNMETLRTNQLDSAIKLASIPMRYEAEMQSNYVPVENIIGQI